METYVEDSDMIWECVDKFKLNELDMMKAKGKSEKAEVKSETPMSYEELQFENARRYQGLFNFFADEHDLILTEGQMDDIIRAVEEHKKSNQPTIEDLPQRVMELCRHRNWSNHWTDRLAYLGLESAEFVEAVRGKNGDKVEEAGDVLITAIALIIPHGVTLQEALNAADLKIKKLMNAPRYKNEEFKNGDPFQSRYNAMD